MMDLVSQKKTCEKMSNIAFLCGFKVIVLTVVKSHCIFNISLQSDLQLAAELGNTLLERNKDLESTIKHQQGVIEDQIQEIEVGTRQAVVSWKF